MYRLARHVHRLRTIGDFLQPTEEERRKMSQMGDIIVSRTGRDVSQHQAFDRLVGKYHDRP